MPTIHHYLIVPVKYLYILLVNFNKSTIFTAGGDNKGGESKVLSSTPHEPAAASCDECLHGASQEGGCQDQKFLVIVLLSISAYANGGPRSRVCAAPIDERGNFPPYVSAESPLNISPNWLELISKVSEI